MPVLFLQGIVGNNIVPEQVKDFLKKEKAKDVTVVINSAGGSVFEGLEVYNLLKNSGRNVTTVLSGLAASMGSIIFLAGDERIALDGTLFMIHKPSALSWGNADDLKKDVEMLDKVQVSLENIYKKRTNIQNVTELINNTTWFDTDEMLEHGVSNSERKIIIDYEEDEIRETEEIEDMALIDDLKAELEEQKKLTAAAEEKNEELLLQKQVEDEKAKLAEIEAKNKEIEAKKNTVIPQQQKPSEQQENEEDEEEPAAEGTNLPTDTANKPIENQQTTIITDQTTKITEEDGPKIPYGYAVNSKY